MTTSTTLNGFGTPLTRTGRSSLYGPPPWHMSGRLLTIWYRPANPEALQQFVMPPLSIPTDALCRVRFWELMHDAGRGNALPSDTPAQTRFCEAVLAIDVQYEAMRGDYSVNIYANEPTYVAWAREVIGWPVKMGQVSLNNAWRPHMLQGGDKFTGVLERFGQQLLRGTVTLKHPIDPAYRPYSLANWFTFKIIPSAAQTQPEIAQLVLVQPITLELGTVWECEGAFQIDDGPNDELQLLNGSEIVWAEYGSYVNLKVGYGTILEQVKCT